MYVKEELRKTHQQDEDWRVGRQLCIVAGDPVESNGAIVLGPQTLTSESDVGKGAEEGGEYGLQVAVPSNHRIRIVGAVQGFKCREE